MAFPDYTRTLTAGRWNVDIKMLATEIVAVAPGKAFKLRGNGTAIVVDDGDSFSAGEQTATDTAVSDHIAADDPLAAKKTLRKAQADARTVELLAGVHDTPSAVSLKASIDAAVDEAAVDAITDDRVLATSEAVASHTHTALHDTAHSPVGLYQFQGDFTDDSGNGRDLTEVGTPVYGPGHAGGYISWVNASEAGERTGAAAAPFRIAGALTVECLVRPAALSSFQTIAIVDGAAAADADNIQWAMQTNGALVRYIHEGPVGTFRVFEAGHLVIGVQSHLAIVRDAAGTEIWIYENGIEVGNTTLASAPTGGSTANLHVGEDVGGILPWIGGLATLEIIAAELTAAQVLARARLVLGG